VDPCCLGRFPRASHMQRLGTEVGKVSVVVDRRSSYDAACILSPQVSGARRTVSVYVVGVTFVGAAPAETDRSGAPGEARKSRSVGPCTADRPPSVRASPSLRASALS
jgi:hypothetical protein